MHTQHQARYIPQRIVTWWQHPFVRAWIARLTMRVQQALEKVAQGG